jgi:hypothetical protein
VLGFNKAQIRFLWVMRISLAAKLLGLVGLFALLVYLGVLK